MDDKETQVDCTDDANENMCPSCYSTDISGLYSSFWAPLDKQGADAAVNFSDHESCTELTDQRLCAACGHEFEDGDT